jgi:ribosome-associated protein
MAKKSARKNKPAPSKASKPAFRKSASKPSRPSKPAGKKPASKKPVRKAIKPKSVRAKVAPLSSKKRYALPDTKRAQQQAAAKDFAIEAARMLSDDKCEQIVVLDVRNKSSEFDYIVIASGTSDRQMRGAADDVKKMGATTGHDVIRSNLDEQTSWIVLDCGDVVVHVFEPNARAYYDLEMMYGDAKQVPWARK